MVVWMDKIDNQLVTELRRDARAPMVALARTIGLSRSATQARIKRLLDQRIIVGFTIVESQQTAQTAHLLVKLKTGIKCAQIVPQLRKISGIISIHSVAGASDILIQCEAPAIEGLETIRTAVFETVGVETVTTMIVMERHLN